LGAAIGIASGNFGIGLALGVVLGFAFGAAARKKLKSED
jgi:F0F1-type ATP synthase membrane subunit c/vacuolar-type H+-ATPase subunit K